MLKKVSLPEKLSLFSDHWSPKVVGELNGQQVRLVKFQGEFAWHHHENEDELFLVLRGQFRMELQGQEPILLAEDDFLIVPRGVIHRPVAAEEVSVLLFEPSGTVNTGTASDSDSRTVLVPQRL